MINIRQRLIDGIHYGRTLMSTPPSYPDNRDSFGKEDEYHSPLGWSGAERNFACHGAVALAEFPTPLKSIGSPAADLGTLAHHAAAHWLVFGYPPKGLDPEIENSVRHYVYAVWKTLPKVLKPGKFRLYLVESRVSAPSVHPECTGTVDALVYDEVEGVLDVHDLKYGKGKVDAKENAQLMGYAGTAIIQYKLANLKKVRLWIHQVRLSPKPDMWECDELDIEMFMQEAEEHFAACQAQRDAVKRHKDPRKLELHAGGHCRYCPAWPRCHEREDAAKRQGIELFQKMPETLPADAGKLVLFAKKAEPWVKAILKKARAHMIKGGKIEGLKLVAGKRSRVPADVASFEDSLTGPAEFDCMSLAKELVYTEPKLKTVNQIRDALPEALQKEFDKLWKWVDGAPVIAAADDKRPAIKGNPDDWFRKKELEESEDETEDDTE